MECILIFIKIFPNLNNMNNVKKICKFIVPYKTNVREYDYIILNIKGIK